MKGVKTGGRRKGVPNKATAAKAAAIAASGLTPLDFMLGVMRDECQELGVRLDAAKAAAQYVHPKLQPVDGKTGSAVVQARVIVEFVGSAT
jgi:formylmethanofuran dehydrogenase subunit B